ncbi:MAG: hypothetical protein NZ551_07790 [Microscillaceae bacterium]|nr:hypothetical protein [Microscillaceae bacterium]MDW8461097.1 hypothetical protein [Cytophagales bacterium]
MSVHFDSSGKFLGQASDNIDVAVWNGNQVPYITGSQLMEYAATVYAESTPTAWLQAQNPSHGVARERTRETFAIVFAMYNYVVIGKGVAMKRRNQTYGLAELLTDTSYTKGITSPAHKEYYEIGKGDEPRRREATLSVIRLFTNQVQDVQDVIKEMNGAMYWDGNDLFRRFPDHFRCRMGFQLGNPAHGAIYQNLRGINPTLATTKVITDCPATDPKISAQRQFTYLSTFVAGGTIFFRIHPQAIAQGVTW